MSFLPSQRAAFRRFWPIAAAVFGVCGAVLAFQLSRGAYTSNLAQHPDEAAHMVTGICVLDYFRTAFGSDPLKFVESYYVRYPKLALGHWPPMFYIVQAAWYAVFGESTFSAILLIGAIAAVATTTLLLALRRTYGWTIAALSACAFVVLPLVRMSQVVVLSDMLASLFALFAFLELSTARSLGRLRPWIAFATWTIAAALTKESAVVLIAVAPAAFVFSRAHILRSDRAKPVLLVLAIVGVTAIAYALAGVWKVRGFPTLAGSSATSGRLAVIRMFLKSVPLPMILIAAFGLFRAGVAPTGITADRWFQTRLAGAWLVFAVGSQLIFRQDAMEPRYLLPACFPLVMLFAEGLCLIQEDVARRIPRRPALAGFSVALAAITVAFTPELKLHQRTGYADVAASIPYDSGSPVVLVSADSDGEGALVLERLIGDESRDGVNVRASKLLSSSDWMGRGFTLRAKSADDVRRTLDTVPVHYIVLDMYGFISGDTRLHHRLLEDTVSHDPQRYRLCGDFPLYADGHRRDHAVQVYENLNARGRRPRVIEVDMTKTLGRSLSLRLPESGPETKIRSRQRGFWLSSFGAKERPGSLTVAPDEDSIDADGGSGRVYVAAPAGQAWSVEGVPSWIALSGSDGQGDGLIRLEVAQNRSNDRRSCVLRVGPATFELSQPRSAYTYLPFVEQFKTVPAPLSEIGEPDPTSIADPVGPWFLDDVSRQKTAFTVARTGPGGAGSLIIDKPLVDDEPWKTQVLLPRLDVHRGGTYELSVWLQSDYPATVLLTLGQRNPPYRVCGFSSRVSVDTNWTQFRATFPIKDDGCQSDNNRLAIEAGLVSGRLSISKLSLTEVPPDSGLRQ